MAGGSEAAITGLAISGFQNMKALSTRNDAPEQASRPFDKERDGFVLGDGSAMVVLESLEHATDRGAAILGEVIGYGMSADAYHMTAPAPEGEGAQRAMRDCLADGNIAPADVGYVNAHGTSTPLGDVAETVAVKTVFGDHARKLIFGSTKSMTGHLLGGAGAPGVRGLAPGGQSRQGPAHHQSGRARSRLRPRLRPQRHGGAPGRRRHLELLRVRRPQRHPRGSSLPRLTRPRLDPVGRRPSLSRSGARSGPGPSSAAKLVSHRY